MSVPASLATQVDYDMRVKAAYGSKGGVLRPTARLKTDWVGTEVEFRLGDEIVAYPDDNGVQDIKAANSGQDVVRTSTRGWRAGDYIKTTDVNNTNIDDRAQIARKVGGAMGRREDQVGIDALVTGQPTVQIDTDVGGAGTGLNLAKLRRAKAYFDHLEVPETDRYMLTHAMAIESLLGQVEVTSADYANAKALVDGKVDYFLGFRFKTIGRRPEGGLPRVGNVCTSFAFHGGADGAIGMAWRFEGRTMVDWVAEKGAYLVQGMLKVGAVVIDPLGVIRMEHTETAPPVA